MTVGIAAVCADRSGRPGKAVIVASDRMVTHGGITEFEHDVPKINRVADLVLTLHAGDALRGARLAREVAARTPSGPISLDHVVQIAVDRYATQRREQIESEVFAPRGVTMEEFYKNGLQQRFVPPIAGGIDQEVMRYNLGVDVLIAGVDDEGGHVHLVGNPGRTADFTPIGFHAIGSGAIHALQSLIGLNHTGARGLNESVFAVYTSKRRAEVAPGVGKHTDVAVVCDDGVHFLDQRVLDQLAELFELYQHPVADELKERVQAMELF